MNNKHKCLVCLGSNIDDIFHLKNAEYALIHSFQEVVMGTPVVTVAEGGMVQPDYRNQAARFVTDLDCESVIQILKQIERDNGRTADDKLVGRVPLDIDLLIYDDEIIKPCDLNKGYVQLAVQSLPSLG